MKNTAIIFLIIFLMNVPLAVGFTSSDIEWASPVTATLHKGDTLTKESYTVKAVQFPSPVPGYMDFNKNIVPETQIDPMVYLEVYKNGTLMREMVMNMQSEPEIDKDYEVKVELTNILPGNAKGWVLEYYDPWAAVSLSLRGKPKLDVTVTTDKTAYTSDADAIITATAVVTNNGDAVAKNVDVNLNTGDLTLRGGSDKQFHHNYLELKKGESQSFTVILLVPRVNVDKTYSLEADAKGYDVKEIEYSGSGSGSITISPKGILPRISISKAVAKRIYLKDPLIVRITVGNGGDFDAFDLNISDIMNENFILESNSTLHWEVPVLKQGQDWSTSYSMKSLEANINGFTIPPVSAQFTVNNNQYTVSSDSSDVIVNGPEIILNKTVDKQIINKSDEINVTVSIKNSGDIGTRILARDYLPESASLVNGTTSLDSVFLEVNSQRLFNYTIKLDSVGEIELPSAVANFTDVDYKGLMHSAISSERPVITVIDPDNKTALNNSNSSHSEDQIQAPVPVASPVTETPAKENPSKTVKEPTPTPITPSVDTFLTIVVFIVVALSRRL